MTPLAEETMAYDEVLNTIADYVCSPPSFSQEAIQTARACLADTLGCGLLALNFPACTKLLGPLIPGTQVPKGCRVPGTDYILDPVRAAFNIGTLVRWLDYNDTWLAAEWGHPSDNLGGLLAVGDFISQRSGMKVSQLLHAMIQAHEIQGGLALQNSFNRIGFDHVILVKVATAAVTARLLGGDRHQVRNAVSQAWIDTGPLRTYRHAPNTGSRKSWAAGDATARGLQLAWITLQGEMGYPTALSAPKWGFNDVLKKGESIVWERPLGCYVMEHVLFKISFPAEFHAQTAVEAAIELHPLLKDKEVKKVQIETHESAIRIIDKKGVLHNPADRDHCLQYMVAIGLLHGKLTADHYEDEAAADPAIDQLRSKMEVVENPFFTQEYMDPEKRSISNAITLTFTDGSKSKRVEVHYPVGHRRRRKEGLPLLYDKFEANTETRLGKEQTLKLKKLWQQPDTLDHLQVSELIEHFLP